MFWKLLCFSCSFSFVVANDFDVYERNRNEVRCTGTPTEKRPLLGLGLFAHSWHLLEPANRMGPEIFDFSAMEQSDDCTAWVAKGYISERSRRWEKNIVVHESQSLKGSEKVRETAMNMAVGGQWGSIGASASFSQAGSHKVMKSERMRRKYFAANLVQVDVSLAFDHHHPPVFSTSFKNDMETKKNELLANTTTKEDAAMFFIEKYGHFLLSGELGSRASYLKMLSQHSIKQAQEDKSDLEAKAEVHCAFVKAAGGFSASSATEKQRNTMFNHSISLQNGVGDKLVLGDSVLDGPTLDPGLVTANHESICHLLGLDDDGKTFVDECWKRFNDKSSCFVALKGSGNRLKNEDELDNLRALFERMRLFSHCEDIPPPMFEMKHVKSSKDSGVINGTDTITGDQKQIAFGHSLSHKFTTVFDCSDRCEKGACDIWSFTSTKSECSLCFSNVVFELDNISNKSICEQFASNGRPHHGAFINQTKQDFSVGVTNTVTFDKTRNVCYVRLHTDHFSKENCHNMETCGGNENCVSGMFSWPQHFAEGKMSLVLPQASFLMADWTTSKRKTFDFGKDFDEYDIPTITTYNKNITYLFLAEWKLWGDIVKDFKEKKLSSDLLKRVFKTTGEWAVPFKRFLHKFALPECSKECLADGDCDSVWVDVTMSNRSTNVLTYECVLLRARDIMSFEARPSILCNTMIDGGCNDPQGAFFTFLKNV